MCQAACVRAERIESTVPGNSIRSWSDWQLAFVYGMGYLVLGELGLQLDLPPTNFAVFWPAAGLALAVFLVAPYRLWPKLIVAQAVVNGATNLLHGHGTAITAAFVTANVLESTLGAAGAREWRRLVPRSSASAELMARPLLAGVVNTMIAALVATTALIGLDLTGGSFFVTWRGWWVADSVGILTVAPVLLFVATEWRVVRTRARQIEAVGAIVLAWALTAVLFAQDADGASPQSAVYLLLPALLWPALRGGRAVTAAAVAGCVFIAVWATSRGSGPFVGSVGGDAHDALDVQLFLSVLGATVLAVAFSVELLRRAERDAALHSNERAERARLTELYERTSTLAAERERLLDRANLLADVSRVLDEALAVDTQLAELARLLSVRLDAWCGIDLLLDDGGVPMLDPRAQAGPIHIATRRRPAPTIPPLSRALAGRPVLVPAINDEAVRLRVGGDDERFEALRGHGMTAAILSPITTAGAVYGLVNIVALGRERAFDEDDVQLVFDVGRRAGQAVRNAQLYERQREIATSLQASLLPDSLPIRSGYDLAARYVPGEIGLDVGGDWYDAFTGADDRLHVAVGDIVGGGLEAASATGQLRSGLRALSARCAGPADLLAELDSFATGVRGAEVATIAYVELDPETGEFRYGCAGHPPPLIVGVDGSRRFLDEGRSTPLVTIADPWRREAIDHLAEGETLLLYTDGLFERRGETLDDGLDRLARSSQRHAVVGSAAALLDLVVADLVPVAGPTDDVCIVAIGRPVADDRRFQRVFRAEAPRLAHVRRAMRAWMVRHAIEPSSIDDVLLAVFEAAGNSVEHAYRDGEPGAVAIEAIFDGQALGVEVRDDGSWRSPAAPGDRGRGTGLMRAVMDAVDLRVSASGTTVMLRKELSGGRAQG